MKMKKDFDGKYGFQRWSRSGSEKKEKKKFFSQPPPVSPHLSFPLLSAFSIVKGKFLCCNDLNLHTSKMKCVSTCFT